MADIKKAYDDLIIINLYIIMAFVKESIIYINDTRLLSDSILYFELETFEYQSCYFLILSLTFDIATT